MKIIIQATQEQYKKVLLWAKHDGYIFTNPDNSDVENAQEYVQNLVESKGQEVDLKEKRMACIGEKPEVTVECGIV
jgi:hypothetical protein